MTKKEMKIRNKNMSRAFRKRLPTTLAFVFVMSLLGLSFYRQRQRKLVKEDWMEEDVRMENAKRNFDENSKVNSPLSFKKEIEKKTTLTEKISEENPLSSDLAQKTPVTEDVVLNPAIVKHEKNLKNKWDHDIEIKKFKSTMPNKRFIFHNKLPKSGSTTMNNILKVLKDNNGFNFLKIESGEVLVRATKDLVDYVEANGDFRKPYFLLKHHVYFDFTKFGGKQPTYINVVRDPLTWITSRYYFARYGWELKPGCRVADCKMSKEDQNMEIDECVRLRRPDCTMDSDYLKFFCGYEPECLNASTYAEKRVATERAKYNILHNFFVVGILEQFEDTLNVFERLMPSFYKGALKAYETDQLQASRNQTKTTYKKEMSEESMEFLRNGPLHHEVELYEFAKKIFNLRMKQLKIKPVIKEEN